VDLFREGWRFAHTAVGTAIGRSRIGHPTPRPSGNLNGQYSTNSASFSRTTQGLALAPAYIRIGASPPSFDKSSTPELPCSRHLYIRPQ